MIRNFIGGLAVAVALSAQAQSWAWDDGTTPFVVSPDAVVERMLYLAQPGAGERLVDLGSGDGRIVIEAAKRFGAKGLGVDIDPKLVRLARENARRAGVEALATFEVRDLFETDLRGVNVVTMYLLPEVNLKLLPRLIDQLKPGARIVSHDYDLGPWPFDEMIELALAEKMVGPLGRSRVFLWLVPADARVGGSTAGSQMVVRGEDIRLAVTGMVAGKGYNVLFRGKVGGGVMEGDLRLSDGDHARILPWKAARQ